MKKLNIALLPAVALLAAFLFHPLPVFAEEDEDASYGEVVTDPLQEPDAIFTEFEVLEDNGYTVNMYHSYQGPLCDAAFAVAQGNNMLVTDYFNVSINNNLRIYEIASEVRLRVRIPVDLVQKKRTWWMICISRNGNAYVFYDEDDSDETITFTANRFYAYAMCYTDEEVEIAAEEEVIEEVDENPRSRMHNITDSRTISGKAQEDIAERNARYNTAPVVFYGTKTNRLPQMKSSMVEAMERANEMRLPNTTPVYYFIM